MSSRAELPRADVRRRRRPAAAGRPRAAAPPPNPSDGSDRPSGSPSPPRAPTTRPPAPRCGFARPRTATRLVREALPDTPCRDASPYEIRVARSRQQPPAVRGKFAGKVRGRLCGPSLPASAVGEAPIRLLGQRFLAPATEAPLARSTSWSAGTRVPSGSRRRVTRDLSRAATSRRRRT